MRIGFLIIGGLFAGSLLAASPEYQHALDLYQHTEYRQAIVVLAKTPNKDAETLLLLGRAYFGAGDYAMATEVLEKAVERSPRNSSAYAWLGRAWGRRAETSAIWNQPRYAAYSRDAFEKSLELDPDNHDALDDLSEFYLQAPGWLGGGVNKAEALAKHIASLDAAWGKIAYARIKEQQKDFAGAESNLRQAVELAPRQASKLLTLATFLAKRGLLRESDDQFAIAAALAPNDPEVLFARARTLVEEKRNPDEARKLLTQYLALNLTPENPSRDEAQKLLQKLPKVIGRFETLRSSVHALKANRFRAFLTALGLVIGNASVIWVVTISLASRDFVLTQIQRIGSNLIYANYEAGSNARADAAGDFVKIADVDAVRAQLGVRVVGVTGVMISADSMRIDGRQEDIGIIGADEYYPQVRGLERLAGRFLDAGDVATRNRVAMLTEKLARRLFGSQSQAVGQRVKLHGLQFDVVGTFKEHAESFGLSELKDENVLVPSTTLKLFAPLERVDPLYVSTRSAEDVEPVTHIVRTILEGRHRPGARYTVDNLSSILETARDIAALLTGVLILVSGIALIISGIGIMNIMLVTVTERTREIGLRLAVGASRRDILEQFLTEAILISMGGGIVGIAIGVSVPLAVRFLAPEWAIPISGISIVVAFSVSLLVGLIFGLLPANRASRLNPTEALRYE